MIHSIVLQLRMMTNNTKYKTYAFQEDSITAKMAAPQYSSVKPGQHLGPGDSPDGRPMPMYPGSYSGYSGASFTSSFDPDNIAVDRHPVYSG